MRQFRPRRGPFVLLICDVVSLNEIDKLSYYWKVIIRVHTTEYRHHTNSFSPALTTSLPSQCSAQRAPPYQLSHIKSPTNSARDEDSLHPLSSTLTPSLPSSSTKGASLPSAILRTTRHSGYLPLRRSATTPQTNITGTSYDALTSISSLLSRMPSGVAANTHSIAIVLCRHGRH